MCRELKMENVKQSQTNLIYQMMQKQQMPTEQKPVKKGINRKAVVCSIAAAAGIIAVTGVIIHKVRTGKTNDIKIKKFFDKDNRLIEGVTIKKGKALNPDNTMFSGIMNTVNGKGEKITLEYQDGFIVNSSINGKLFKKFENIDNLTRNQGVQITKFNNNGERIHRTFITNYDNGKVKRIYKNPNKDFKNVDMITAAEFSKNGSKIAEAEYLGSGVLQQARIYDENGKLTRELGKKAILEKSCDYNYIEKVYDSNGKLKIVKEAGSEYCESCVNPTTYMLSEHKLFEPNFIQFYNSDGSINQSISIKAGSMGQRIDVLDKNEQFVNLEEILNSKGTYSLFINGEEGNLMNTAQGSRELKLDSRVPKFSSRDEIIQQITKAADKLENAWNIMQKEGMPYKTGKDIEVGSTHFDVLDIIKQMRDFVSSY